MYGAQSVRQLADAIVGHKTHLPFSRLGERQMRFPVPLYSRTGSYLE
jgi:hypothetical protein